MAIEAGQTTYWQAKRGTVQGGLVFSFDAAVGASYTSGTTWYDLSGGGNNGTLTNGPTFNAANGGSIVFDGSDDYVVDADGENYINGLTAATMEAWVKSDVTGVDRSIFGAGGDRDRYFHLRYDADAYIGSGASVIKAVFGDSGSNVSQVESAAGTQTTSWQHIMVTWVADAVPIMYINGSVTTPVGTADGGPVIVGATEFVIGAGTSGPNYEWNGSIAIVKIYNRALTGTEILKNYNATKGRFT